MEKWRNGRVAMFTLLFQQLSTSGATWAPPFNGVRSSYRNRSVEIKWREAHESKRTLLFIWNQNFKSFGQCNEFLIHIFKTIILQQRNYLPSLLNFNWGRPATQGTRICRVYYLKCCNYCNTATRSGTLLHAWRLSTQWITTNNYICRPTP